MLVLGLTWRAFLLSLVSLAEKGKQCYEQAASGNQQTDYPQENHNSFICCHWHHLPPYVFRQTGPLSREATTPVVGSVIQILAYFVEDFNLEKVPLPRKCCGQAFL